MPRLVFVIVCAAVIAMSALLRDYGVAFVVGVAVGAVLFLYGMARGAAIGSVRSFERRPPDISARIGIALAAAGIASASIGHDPPYPPTYRTFYWVCLFVGCTVSVFLAVKTGKSEPRISLINLIAMISPRLIITVILKSH